MTEPKRLYRSRTNRVLAGVCGGIAEYANLDPTLVRVLWAVATLLLAFVGGVLAYVIAWLLIPEKPFTLAEAPVARV